MFSLFTRSFQRSSLGLSIFLLTLLITITGQPLNLPAIRFQCGPVDLGVTCERWGYETCISDNGEYYCLPCYHGYLTTLCGTQDEREGCNLYCTQKALDKETERLTANFTEQLTYLKTQINLSKKEAESQTKRLHILEESLLIKSIALYAVTTALGLVLIALTIILIRRCFHRTPCKFRHDEETPELSARTPLKEVESSDAMSEVSEETHLKEHNIPPDSLEELKDIDTEEEAISATSVASETENGQGNNCPAVEKLCSVPATNRTGNNKLAIKTHDLSHP